MEKDQLQNQKIVFFDGVCHLCNGFVDQVISSDTKKRQFLFAPLQGMTAELLLKPEDRAKLDSVIYFEAGRVYTKSTAVLKILSQLGGFYKLFGIARIIPTGLRDIIYSLIAKNRYAWFGERDFCRLPQPEERAYLLP